MERQVLISFGSLMNEWSTFKQKALFEAAFMLFVQTEEDVCRPPTLGSYEMNKCTNSLILCALKKT